MTQRLLPRPKELSLSVGQFPLSAGTQILLPAISTDSSFLWAKQLQVEATLAAEGSPQILKTYTAPQTDNVILLVCGSQEAAALDLEPPSISVSYQGPRPNLIEDQAYALTISPSSIVVYSVGQAGLFYGIQTLRQLVRLYGTALPALTISDWPTLPFRGLMLDISRRKVPKAATLEKLAEELGHYKLNVLQLYTEHTFQFPSHPRIGAGCGSLSGQDIIELDLVCRQHHVELMPNLQSFGHARHTLLLPDYQHLAETDLHWTLSPALDGTYALLNDLYGDLLPSFTSQTFNVGCDETYDLGQGTSKKMAEEVGVGRVYLDHILWVRELAARYGRCIQVWGDILLQYPDLVAEIPDDVTLLDWHYGPADEYPSVEVFAQAGQSFWVCPGVGSWNSLFPRLYGSNRNIRNLVRDGVAAGAEGVLNTDWGDFGHYQPLGLSWYGYVFGAVQGWTGGTTSDEQFDQGFGPLFFGPDHRACMEALGLLARTNDLPGVHRPNRSHTVLALFDDPLNGATVEGEDALPARTLAEMRALADKAAAICEAEAPGHPRELTLREMGAAACLTGYAARKASLGQAIRAALRQTASQPESAREKASSLYKLILMLKALDAELETLRSEFEEIWLYRARRSEIHVALGYWSNLRSRFTIALSWLTEQHRALLAGEPIDGELDTYDSSEYLTLWQTWPEM